MKLQAPRGTEDVLPVQAVAWRHVESTFFQVTHEFGYSEIRTPTFEDTSLFLRTSGETSDVVSKEMYTFTDKGGRRITLRPELTAPAMRAVIEHSLCAPGTVLRLAYSGPIFRYGRPQEGRLREAHQVGLELIGSASVDADAEILEATYRFFQRLHLPANVFRINSIGREECRRRYREVVLAYVAGWLAEQTTEEQAKAHRNPLRLLDTKDETLKAALVGVPSITDYLENDSRAHFDLLQARLTEAKVPYVVDPAIVRGLDYYTGMVFEVVAKHVANGASLCGGGRYDGLVQQLGGASTPSVGVGIGVERLLLELAGEDLVPKPVPPLAFAVHADDAGAEWVRTAVREAREHHLAVQWDVEGRSLKSQLRQADKSGARYALIAGEDEISRGVVTAKDLHTGESVEVVRSEVANWLTARR